MLTLVNRNQFKADSLSTQIKLMKKANPPPKLEQHKIFEGVKKPVKKKPKRKKRKKKN